MRRLALLLLYLPALGLGTSLTAQSPSGTFGQAPMVSLVRQPRATAAEFTVPFTAFQEREEHATFHLGVGLGLRHWDDGDTAVRLIADANSAFYAIFASFSVVGEIPPGERPFIGPRLRVGWAFHPDWALSLEGEHLERPFSDGWDVKRRSALGLALTYRF